MSDFSNDASPASTRSTTVGHLPEAKVVAHLKACQKLTADRAGDLFDGFVKVLEERLQDYLGKATSNHEATRLQETLRELRTKSGELRRHFIGYLSEGFVKFKHKQLKTYTGEEKYRGDMLALVDNEDLEETIAISSIAHRAEEDHSEILWFLHQRFAVLNDGEKVEDSSNPVSPIQYCESLRKALLLLHIDTKAKIIAYKVFDREFIASVSDILEDVNQYLIDEKILPNLRYYSRNPSGPGGVELPRAGEGERQAAAQAARTRNAFVQPLPQSRIVSTPNAEAPSEQYQGDLMQAIRVLQDHIAGDEQVGGAAAPGAAAAQPVHVYSNQELVSALQNLQTQALAVTAKLPNDATQKIEAVSPQAMAAVGQQLGEELKKEDKEGELDAVDMHTIELVGMLFEYMLSDEHLPDSIKALLSYLHTPFLKVAFLDPNFFEQTEHPARLLLDSLAEAGSRWVSNDGTSQYEIYTKIKQIVSRVLEDFDKDVRLFAELLLEFSSYVKKIARRQDLMEKRAMEKVQGEEKLREVKIQVNTEIRTRTDGKELPSPVLLLLLQPWSDYLAFLLLRYGEQSDSWKKALRAVDDLLWSIEPKQAAKDKSRQMELLDELLEVIEEGFETIGYDQTKGKKLIEAVTSLQQMALQSQKAEPAPAPMRDKLETMAAEKAGKDAGPKEKPTEEEAKMVENLKMIEFGTWFEFEGGKRLKVAWYNSRTMHYMLVDQMGKKVAMRSGLELARGMLSGKAKVSESRSIKTGGIGWLMTSLAKTNAVFSAIR